MKLGHAPRETSLEAMVLAVSFPMMDGDYHGCRNQEGSLLNAEVADVQVRKLQFVLLGMGAAIPEIHRTSGMILGLSLILANNTTSLFTVSSILVSVCFLQITFPPHRWPALRPSDLLAGPSSLGSTFMDSCKRSPRSCLHYVHSTLHSPCTQYCVPEQMKN